MRTPPQSRDQHTQPGEASAGEVKPARLDAHRGEEVGETRPPDGREAGGFTRTSREVEPGKSRLSRRWAAGVNPRGPTGCPGPRTLQAGAGTVASASALKSWSMWRICRSKKLFVMNPGMYPGVS